MQFELPVDTVIAASEIAWEYGVKVVLNPAPAVQVEDTFLKRMYLMTPNEGEAHTLLGLDRLLMPKDLAKAWRDRGFGNAVITLGEKGALVIEGCHGALVHAMPVRAVDTTGAGDIFNAVLVSMLARGMNLHDAARWAVFASGKSVCVRGVYHAIPYYEDIRDHYTAPECDSFSIY